MSERVRVAVAQIAPVWLDRAATTDKIAGYVEKAADETADLVCFGEALLPGYPFWVERTDGARFDSALQKRLYAYYATQAVIIERGDLEPIQQRCRNRKIACYLGVIERAPDRGAHSLYCTLVYIGKDGAIASTHRKLMPTYEERLVWATGDGHGLRVHELGDFTVGGLNCWENWLPLARSALYAQGEDLHVAVWPGNLRNTRELTRFIALESRSFVVSASGLLRREDIPANLPQGDVLRETADAVMADGGSAVAAPDGAWLIEPVTGEERLAVIELDHRRVLEERQNLDVVGHYSRPDVLRLVLNRDRQGTLSIDDTAADELPKG